MPAYYKEEVSSVNSHPESGNHDSECDPLVNRSISQRSTLKNPRSKFFYSNFNSFEIYRRDLKIKKKFKCKGTPSGTSNKRKLDRFSASSRRSLRHVAANCNPSIKSQILLTFHHATPTDGVTVKRLLNSLLTRLRSKIDCRYLWVMEFSRKGNPHIHLYLTCEKTTELHHYLAHTWNRICDETSEHLSVHLHSKNMIPWDMGSGVYVCKYLEKQYQKNVPDSFESVGRFWGCSRGLAQPISIDTVEHIKEQIQPQINLKTGELPADNYTLKFIYRTLRRYHESKVRRTSLAISGKKRKYRSRITKATAASIPNGTLIYNQIMEYLSCLHPRLPF